jgi:group I intron endonuclease
MFYTYAHTKPDGTIFYIGKGKDRRAWVKRNRSPHWKNIVAKYGYEVVILGEYEDESKALSEEIELIAHFRKFGFLVNVTDGGDQNPMDKLEVRQKAAESNRGQKRTAEQRAALSKAIKESGCKLGEKNGMFGRKRTEQELDLISEQTRKKMAEQGLTHKIVVCGKEFNSKRELARFLNVNHKTVQTWIKLGILEEKYNACMA